MKLVGDLVHGFHILAAAGLVVDGSTEKFFLNLARCAENGLRLRRLLVGRGEVPPPASDDVPLKAAVAAADWGRAAAIVEHSAKQRDLAVQEYEDEFLWARVLQLLTVPGPDAAELDAALARLEELDAASYGDRVAVARAIFAKDQEALEQAVVGASQVYALATEKKAAAFGTPVTKFAPHRHLWLEGLALLRLGERVGPQVRQQLRYCPRLARGENTTQYAGDYAIPVA
ncbi:MAG: hypothetical protein QM767_15985 [Anaeromyxobacter sp.]